MFQPLNLESYQSRNIKKQLNYYSSEINCTLNEIIKPYIDQLSQKYDNANNIDQLLLDLTLEESKRVTHKGMKHSKSSYWSLILIAPYSICQKVCIQKEQEVNCQ